MYIFSKDIKTSAKTLCNNILGYLLTMSTKPTLQAAVYSRNPFPQLYPINSLTAADPISSRNEAALIRLGHSLPRPTHVTSSPIRQRWHISATTPLPLVTFIPLTPNTCKDIRWGNWATTPDNPTLTFLSPPVVSPLNTLNENGTFFLPPMWRSILL